MSLYFFFQLLERILVSTRNRYRVLILKTKQISLSRELKKGTANVSTTAQLLVTGIVDLSVTFFVS